MTGETLSNLSPIQNTQLCLISVFNLLSSVRQRPLYSGKCCSILIVLKKTLEKQLAKKIPVVAVVAVMGTTEESAIDPLTEILKIRKEFSKKVRDIASLKDVCNDLVFMTTFQTLNNKLCQWSICCITYLNST